MTIFITAEVGINHNGDMATCKELIDVASESGCDAVKFQKRDIEEVYTKEFLDASRESPWGNTQRDQKEGLEFSKNQYEEIDDYCREKSIEWYASAWDINSQMFLRDFDCKYNKVASAMLVYTPLLEEIASERKHTFISTGMSTYEDIDNAVRIFREADCPFELMHTISTFPMNVANANLNLINTLRTKFDCDVGYSGHEPGLAISCGAAALGITSLERHVTLDRSMYGSDQAASVEPAGLRELVGAVGKIQLAMGDGVKTIIAEEIPVAEKLREHLDWKMTN